MPFGSPFDVLRPLVVRSPALLPLRRARLAWQSRTGGHPDWSSLARDPEWAKAREAAERGPRVLVATTVGLHFAANTVESLLAVALTLRGADVEVLLCDGALPACMACQSDWFPDQARFLEYGPSRDLCGLCHSSGSRMYEALRLPIRRLSEFVGEDERKQLDARISGMTPEELSTFDVEGLPAGEHARAGALRFFARGELESEPRGEAVLRRYALAAALTASGARRLFGEGNYDRVVLHHGIYVPQGVLAASARQGGVKVVTWNPSYRAGTCIFSHGDTYHRTLMTEPTSEWETLELSAEQERRLADYLESRKTGGGDQISFVRQTIPDEPELVLERVGLDPRLPTIGLLTNVVWDAQLHYPANVFPDMLSWLRETLKWFAGHPHIQALVRVHPAEVHGSTPSRQAVVDEIACWMPELPPNIAVIPPHSEINTYSAMQACHAVVIYGTKTGVELAAAGVPVVVAGEAWVRGKGITLDPEDREEYFAWLHALPFVHPMDAEQVARARRYAYHFFFRRMIPISLLRPREGFPPFRVDVARAAEVALGRDPGLDLVCDGILRGAPFIYPSEATQSAR